MEPLIRPRHYIVMTTIDHYNNHAVYLLSQLFVIVKDTAVIVRGKVVNIRVPLDLKGNN